MPELDPSLLVDAHHHLWDLDRRPQPWLEEATLNPIRRSFTLDDLRGQATRSIAGHSLGATVLVQCLASVAETEELLALAEEDSLVGAVVGWADLASPAIGDTLDALLAGPGGTYLRSLRHLVQAEIDPCWLHRPDVIWGLRAVCERGLAYDLLVRPHQLPSAVRLAERHPELRLVLDHAGKPPIADGDLADWEKEVLRLAAHPQVSCKVSGLVTEAERDTWTPEAIRPVWDILLSAFGPERLMFGSDWPLCVLAGGWNRWAGAVEELLASCSATETAAILAGTATDFYQVQPAVKESRL
ncbi:amidohydrolase family protein [Streptomyces pseudovenezuelae]|uniref:L-fuconolactonase n=1 Tax=Streptomyces pseudovenezuelae TaxID=67350 RepID=A0ABT6LUT8_9ACTN|nr:amidohydrolase family protein [Streptomyces pseudovenezuelae]MDH6219589.1 L-fuconolactonase [Streptomyces pseudovenezuelae]